jgi:hypothetical protein
MTASTAQQAPDPTEVRTYGNWRKPSSPGLPGVGLLGTVLLLGGIVVVVLVQLVAGFLAAGIVLLLVIVAVGPMLIKNRAGRNGWQMATTRIAWRRGTRRKQHSYRSGLVGPVPYGSHTLPGLLARSTLYEATDSYGDRFALLHVPATRHYSVILTVDPEGSSLVDPETTDTWVARWGRWLSDLAREPSLVAASATVDTAPDPGNRLAAEIDTLLTADAPELARATMAEIAGSYALASPSVTGRVALTYTATRKTVAERAPGRRRRTTRRSSVLTAQEMAAQIGSRLPGLIRDLATTGAGGGVRALTGSEVADLVRTAYDPAIGGALDALRGAGVDSGVTWADAGPAGQVEDWDCLRHDSGASITWQMAHPPRGTVQAQVLRPLLEPVSGLTRKRVTLQYRPHDPGSAAKLADADVRTAITKAGARKGETKAGDTLELQAARQTAVEEAAGAGLTRFSMLVTATVTDIADLEHAADVIDQAGAASRVELRRAYGAQSASFAAGLGIGVLLNSHVAVPDVLRNYL